MIDARLRPDLVRKLVAVRVVAACESFRKLVEARWRWF
ncbi:MAG: hypothetical protein AVDCRST_MAG93-3609 [uncultured Chloroflexia bacterium]|uniref:Uncharacterized protein n=1 Tax=uncultured Chloroflexia bacterium TaxID=1672391 RepID=A0A6J4JTP3_9CHLR|nr:MAG: hypothetical protein AVDCRST_MAG93-3609 [uncultured Chloroflexia bacterium]